MMHQEYIWCVTTDDQPQSERSRWLHWSKATTRDSCDLYGASEIFRENEGGFRIFLQHRIHTKEQTADSGSDCVGKKPLLIAYNAWPADGGATFNQESIFWGEEKLIS
jgi:hypothetical protein